MGRGLAQKTIDLRNLCYDILEEIQPATVRAVCYRLFVLKAIPNMGDNSTKKISKVLTRAREDEFIPWEWIVDSTRSLERVSQWNNPTAFARSVKRQYRRDLWSQQPRRVEVWSEKSTMNGTLGPVLNEYGVGFRVLRGFNSASGMDDIVRATMHDPQPLRVFYLGDWDPSGMCMSEIDLPKRLARYGGRVELSRLALTADDIARPEMEPTSFPPKKSDSRCPWFVKQFGREAWELDALSPVIVRDRVEEAIVSMITDLDAWDRYEAMETAELSSLEEVLTGWAQLKSA
jgi:hypothetical protein